ncbi:MAG: hypothetical protein MZV64_15715 [Ignavibacteriales bacterium]|nr:hypothetical protein [Ignavibacteriales bacterium]
MFGTRRTADFLSKASWWLGGSLAVLALAINLFFLPGRTTARAEREYHSAIRKTKHSSSTNITSAKPNSARYSATQIGLHVMDLSPSSNGAFLFFKEHKILMMSSSILSVEITTAFTGIQK